MKSLFIQSLIVCFLLSCTPPKINFSDSTQPISSNEPEQPTNMTVCLSSEEQNLYDGIMAYRTSKGLPPIPLSSSLSTVAQLHVKDLQQNRPVKGRCNLHSWSDDYGNCCYTSDHSQAKCMWDKPRELTDYTGNGYEIAHWASNGASASSSLQGWKNSSGHNAVMINQGIWKDVDWNAIGIGIYEEYSVVWFGKESDGAGRPTRCD